MARVSEGGGGEGGGGEGGGGEGGGVEGGGDIKAAVARVVEARAEVVGWAVVVVVGVVVERKERGEGRGGGGFETARGGRRRCGQSKQSYRRSLRAGTGGGGTGNRDINRRGPGARDSARI